MKEKGWGEQGWRLRNVEGKEIKGLFD